MKRIGPWMTTAFAVQVLCMAPAALAQMAPAPPKGEAVLSSITVTATVTKIDHNTREITLKADDGRELSFVADEAVKNFPQIKQGDIVTAVYTEALAYEVKPEGGSPGVATAVAGGSAQPGSKPAAALGRQTTVTVTITAIDPKAPSVTFRGPAGNTRTVKVKYPEKLAAVKVGDLVDITYTEAVAIKVETAPKK